MVAHFNGVKSGQPAGKTLNTVLSGAAVVVRPLIRVRSDSAGVLTCEHWVVISMDQIPHLELLSHPFADLRHRGSVCSVAH